MKPPWKRACRSPRLSLAAALGLVAVVPAPACGPDFPNSYLSESTADLLFAPEGFFTVELARVSILVPPQTAVATPDKTSPRAFSAHTDVDDVRRALAASTLPAAQAQAIGDAYAAARQKLETALTAQLQLSDQARELRDAWPPERQQSDLNKFIAAAADARIPDLTPPAGLPAEFADYFAGAVAWHQGRTAAARTAWEAVLALPEAERRQRSTWAAFMLGRTWAEEATISFDERLTAAAQSHTYCQQVRAFAAAGLPDPLGLAAASYGWEAKASLAAGDDPAAINLYLSQLATGDRTAVASLRTTAERAVRGDVAQLEKLAANEPARRVITAYLVSNDGWNGWERDWAKALSQAGLSSVPDADRLAWTTYETGDFDQARKWAALAPAKAWAAEWIRAKLAMRDGKLDEGETHLRGALAALPVAGTGENLSVFDLHGNDPEQGLVQNGGTVVANDVDRARLLGELGRVCLARDDAPDALTAWLDGLHWEDAAYLAEHVLPLAELRGYVDAHCPSGSQPTTRPYWPEWTPAYLRLELRHLLARRLARADQFDAAALYYPKDLRATYDAYLADVRQGFANAKPAAERAEAFWRAAQSARTNGMALFGTELEPDWSIWEGNYLLEADASKRRAMKMPDPFGPTAQELDRLTENTVPDKRFSYRYRAADLAWWAAALLPNDSDETARILNEVGGWLAARDPEAADRFYQALVIRCGNTDLGRAAAAKHWFPPKAPGL